VRLRDPDLPLFRAKQACALQRQVAASSAPLRFSLLIMEKETSEAFESTAFKQSMFSDKSLNDLKGQSVRGGVAVVLVQGAKLVLTVGSQMALARLLTPADFGLLAMVSVLTGVLGLLRDAGLSVATVQSEAITHEQTSTLFWINVVIGTALAFFTASMAKVLVIFYKEPRLFWVVILVSFSFIFNGFAVQHQALLVRKLRFTAMALIDLLALASGIAVGVVMALLNFGYWSLVGMALTGPAVSTLVLWLRVRWTPGKPVRNSGIRSMLNLGGTATAENIIIYVGYNADRFLLGRFAGATLLGLYGRAYQLVNLPLQYLSSSLFNVIFSALSRLQSDKERACRYFLKSYTLLVSVCVPVTIISALFADDIVPILLGPKWTGSIPILRLLAPTIVAFSLVHPFGWFLLSTGKAMRSLHISFLTAPTVIIGVLIGLHYGPKGVACGYSAAMVMLIIPVIAWAKRDYPMTFRDIWKSVQGPLLSGAFTLLAGLIFVYQTKEMLSHYTQLFLGLLLVAGLYFGFLLFVMRQWPLYSDLVRQVIQRRSPQE
jgi:O-antigen/teichoic acid export membrane protein